MEKLWRKIFCDIFFFINRFLLANDGGIPIAVSEHDKIILQPLHKFLFLSENLDRDIKIVVSFFLPLLM